MLGLGRVGRMARAVRCCLWASSGYGCVLNYTGITKHNTRMSTDKKPERTRFRSWRIGALIPFLIPFMFWVVYQQSTTGMRRFERLFDTFLEVFIGLLVLDVVAATFHWFEDH